MKYRPIGTTGMHASVIGFGTGDNAGLMVVGDERAQRYAVARALDLGINYFDTSPDYGKGQAERNLGRALRAAGTEAIVATKVEIMPDQLDDIEGTIARSLDASLQRLGMDRVDILMIHNPPRTERDAHAPYWTPLTPADFTGPALAGLDRARDAGKVRAFGFACEHAEASAVIAVLASGRYHVMNAWYNLVNPTAGFPMPDGVVYSVDYDNYDQIIGR